MSRREPPRGTPTVRWRHLLPYLAIFVLAPASTYLVGRALDDLLHLPVFPPMPWNLVCGGLVFTLGLLIGIRATRELYALGRGLPWGELNDASNTQRLVTHGVYGYSRNPMTLGYALLPAGMGLLFRSPGMALGIPLLVIAVATAYVKLWEEPRLEDRFGDAYRTYRQTTPFLIPFPPRRTRARRALSEARKETTTDQQRTEGEFNSQ
jgi:protein-S-isoprenylcysteine O-methyltransferase Ste14